jgi:predicted nuclease with TOPRIM domain|tara:strand:- start:977 stop:1222 length:246 start_codon:yes stop_codon:yes gene_type:complete
MSKLSERCEERKNEAQVFADKYNAAKAEIDKLKNEIVKKEQENAQVFEQFKKKNYQYEELLGLLQEENEISSNNKTSLDNL